MAADASARLVPAWSFRPGPDMAIAPPPGLVAAQTLARQAVAATLDAAAPGLTERMIERVAADYMLSHGAQGIWTISNIGLGDNARVCFPTNAPGDLAAAAADVLMVDLHPITQAGFWGDCTRCRIIGHYPEADAALRDITRLHHDVLARCRPGMPAQDVFGMAHERMVEEGFVLLDLLSNIGHSLEAGGAYQQGYIDAGNATPMWGAWAIEPFAQRGEIAVKVEDVVWFGREACTVL